ncbi:MAG: tetratricopeptide repeat protein [Pyrinomonadaceae bacterium]
MLDGHIQRTRERVRVTVQLVSLQDQTPVWAQQFDEAFTDVLRIQDSISEQVAEMLVPQLTGDERRRLAKRGTDDADAFEAYIRGRYHWNTMTEDGFAKAITYYYRAIALDPEYAAAYAGIAEYYSWLSIYGVMPPAECLAAAREAAHRAVDLDETLAEAHTAFGLALITHETQWEMAEVSFRRALELNQSYAPAHIWYACQLAMEGRFEEALGAARRARELDPLNPLNSYILAWCLFQARRYDESIAEAQILVQREPQYGSARMVLSWALRMRRRSDEAIAEAEQAIASAGQTPMFRAALGSAYAAAGRGEEARRVLAELRKLAGNRYVTPYHLALIHLHLGERDAALGLLEESVAVGDPWIVWLGVEPQFDTLRADARFIELLRRTRNPSALAARRADAAEDATARYVAAVGAVTSSGQTALTKPSPAPTFGNKISDAFRELQLLRGRSAAVRLAVPIFATLGVVAVAFLFTSIACPARRPTQPPAPCCA